MPTCARKLGDIYFKTCLQWWHRTKKVHMISQSHNLDFHSLGLIPLALVDIKGLQMIYWVKQFCIDHGILPSGSCQSDSALVEFLLQQQWNLGLDLWCHDSLLQVIIPGQWVWIAEGKKRGKKSEMLLICFALNLQYFYSVLTWHIPLTVVVVVGLLPFETWSLSLILDQIAKIWIWLWSRQNSASSHLNLPTMVAICQS